MVAMREVFGKALLELGSINENVVVMDADLGSSTKTTYFAQKFPDRFFQVGIAEQNMVGIAAGLASCGKIPFATTFAVFLTKRAADQVSISVAYPRFNVKLIGAYTGLFNGATGASHMAVEDMAIMRAIPGIVVIDPADAEEMKQAIKEISEYKGPVYLRETRDEWPDIFNADYKFSIGKSSVVLDGEDVTIIACGVMTSESIKAAEILKKSKINARVINMSTIKPIDTDMIIECASKTGAIVVAENHNIYGGLGSAVAEVLAENIPTPMLRIGIRDILGETGRNHELLEKYEMSAEYIVGAAKRVINNNKNLDSIY